jgi:large subunit ribosomal protein L13
MKAIDFENAILGRAASKTAKMLLQGESVIVLNAEKAVIRGTKTGILEKFLRRYGWRAKGNPITHGPKSSRMPDRLVYRTIQHMLPYRQARGKEALTRLKVFLGKPKRFEKMAAEKWAETKNEEKKNFLTIQQISEELGLKQR